MTAPVQPGYGDFQYGYTPYGDPSTVVVLGAPSPPITVYAYDLNTNTLLTALAATNITFSERMNDAGECAFNLSLADPGSTPINQLVLGYGGAPFKVIIDSGGVILYSGIAWSTTYDSQTRVLSCGAKGLMSYFSEVILTRDYSVATYPTGITQPLLAQAAIVNTQADSAGANIGVQTQLVLGATQPKLIPGYPLKSYQTVAQILSDVTAAITPGTGGTDYTMRNQYNPTTGLPVHTCVLTTPRCGRIGSLSGLVFDMSKAIHYSWPTDSSLSGNQVIAVGASNGTTQLVTVVSSGIGIGGLGQPPLLQAVVQYTGISSATQLAAVARGVVQNIGRASISTPTITFPANYGPAALGSFVIGDDIMLHCPPNYDPRFPAGLDQTWRIVAYSVTVADQGVSTIAFTLNIPPSF